MARNPIDIGGSPPRKVATGSNVVHRPRGAAPLLRATPEVVDRHTVDDAGHRLLDLAPQVGEIASVVRAPRIPAARLGPLGALHGAQHGPDRDLVGRPREPIATGRSAPGDEEPRAPQPEQHLLEISLRNALARGDVLNGREILAGMKGEVEQRLDRVFALRRQPHARPCSMSRARSFAKYVMMMSAPARRIPVSASTMARSSSSQPSCPAARIIAYSPETE